MLCLFSEEYNIRRRTTQFLDGRASPKYLNVVKCLLGFKQYEQNVHSFAIYDPCNRIASTKAQPKHRHNLKLLSQYICMCVRAGQNWDGRVAHMFL